MESFPPPHYRTNPYLVQLFGSFPEEIDARYFSRRDALLGNFDVFHLHWPEVAVRGVNGLKSLLRGTIFLLVLLRIRIGKKALVRTLHDQVPHEAPNFLQRWVIDLSERWTTLWIVLGDGSHPPPGSLTRSSVIGHFKNWFEHADIEPVPGRLLHFGLVRRYKGVDNLVREFQKIEDPDLTMRIVGAIEDEDLERRIVRATEADSRITAVSNYVPDEQLVEEVLSSSLVVLPFTRITNSSSLILALSLNRPVLAPAAPSIVEGAHEVGDDWVFLYEGDLTSAHIEWAMERIRGHTPSAPPDLSSRDWERIGREHAEAFRFAYAAIQAPAARKRRVHL
ncbi:MAG: glycosyltransferase [Microthrixaceae bacterium]